MLEFLRRQTKPIMITLAAIIILAFTFWGGQTNQRPHGQVSAEDHAFTIYGKEYSFAERSRLERLYSLAYGMQLTAPSGRGGFADMMGYIVQKYQFEDRTPADFVFNLLVLRHEMEANGIQATNAEAKDAFKKLPMFQSNGVYDANIAERFQSAVTAQGMRDSDVFDLLRDWVGFQRLQQVVAGNAVLNSNIAKQLYAANFQTIKAASIPFAQETFKKDAQITDEEIAKYYEEKKDTFMTAPKRGFSYVYFAKPDVEKLNAEDTVKVRNESTTKINNFGEAVIKPGAKLDQVAEASKVELKKVGLFALETPPDDLKEEFTLLSEVFKNDPKVRPVSDPVEGSKGYYFFSVTETEDPKQQDLETVKESIKTTLVDQKAKELMTKAANEAKKKVEESIKAGKTFADAAKEAALTPQELAEFSPSNPPMDLSNGREIAIEASTTAAGSFTKPLPTENGLLLVYVLSKELRKRDDGATTKANIEKSVDTWMQGDIFRSWFQRQREAGKEDISPIQRRLLGMK
ncbi:MAG: peptidyl-prolyl cis-trans isomerase [Verrucomicrobium sp.]